MVVACDELRPGLADCRVWAMVDTSWDDDTPLAEAIDCRLWPEARSDWS